MNVACHKSKCTENECSTIDNCVILYLMVLYYNADIGVTQFIDWLVHLFVDNIFYILLTWTLLAVTNSV